MQFDGFLTFVNGNEELQMPRCRWAKYKVVNLGEELSRVSNANGSNLK